MTSRKVSMLFAATFTTLASTALADSDDLTLDDLPPAVRATVDREVGQGVVDDVEFESKGGQTYFEVEFTLDRTEWELHVAEDGTLLRRSPE